MTLEPNAVQPLSAWEVLRAQVSVVFLRRRTGLAIFLAFVLAQVVALAGFGVILGLTISTSEEVTEVGMSPVSELHEALQIDPPQAVSAIGVAFVILSVFALFWPFGVWSDERPSRRGYHWSLPVPRRTHDLARVATGAILLVGVLALVYTLAIFVSWLGGNGGGLGGLSVTFWSALFLGPLIPYALTSIILVRSENPARIFWGGLGAIAVISTVAGVAGAGVVNHWLATIAVGRGGLIPAVGGTIWSEIWRAWASGDSVLGSSVAGVPTAHSGGAWFALWSLWIVALIGAIVLASSTRSRSG